MRSESWIEGAIDVLVSSWAIAEAVDIQAEPYVLSYLNRAADYLKAAWVYLIWL